MGDQVVALRNYRNQTVGPNRPRHEVGSSVWLAREAGVKRSVSQSAQLLCKRHFGELNQDLGFFGAAARQQRSKLIPSHTIGNSYPEHSPVSRRCLPGNLDRAVQPAEQPSRFNEKNFTRIGQAGPSPVPVKQ